MAQRIRVLVGIAISAFFLYWAVLLVGSDNLKRAAESIQHANYWFVLPALAAYFAGVWLRAARWRVLLTPVKSLEISALFPVVVIGYMANDVLPARLGEVVRAYVLGEQEGIPKTTTLATIVVERLFDGIAMLVFVAFVGLIVPLSPQVAAVFRVATVLFVVVLAALFAAGVARSRALALVELVDLRLPTAARGRVAPLAERFLQGLDSLQSGRASATVLALSLGAWCCEAAMYYTIALGFPLHLDFPVFVLTAAVANLGAMIPGAPGYVGTFDVFAVGVLTFFGTDRGVAGGYVAVLHLALLGPVTLLGFYYLWRSNLSLRTLGQRATVASK
jgi:uncharacterized protein (TIRG00374 family)